MRFSSSITLPKTDKNHKTGTYYSTLQVCRILGIDHKTYCQKEGTVFPIAKRLPNGFRIFTEDDIINIKQIIQMNRRR